MEIPIIYKSEVPCRKFGFTVLLSVCRTCLHYRYETVDGKVICNHVPQKRLDGPKRVAP